MPRMIQRVSRNKRDRRVESCRLQHIPRSGCQGRDESRQHLVDELVGKRLPKDLPESGFVRLQLCFGRSEWVPLPTRSLSKPSRAMRSNSSRSRNACLRTEEIDAPILQYAERLERGGTWWDIWRSVRPGAEPKSQDQPHGFATGHAVTLNGSNGVGHGGTFGARYDQG